MTASTFFKARRKEVGLSRREMACRINVAIQTVSSWDRGDAFPRPQQWDAIAAALDVPAERVACEVLKAARGDRRRRSVA